MRPALARRLLLMTLLLVFLTLFATTLGAMRLPLVNLLPSGDEMLRHIWLSIRLPRVLLALLVGAALALSGCVMQGLFRNPLADPGLLGISSGAALAVASWLVLPFSATGLIALYMPMLAAFIGSLAVMVVIFILSRAEEGSLSRLLLVGIAINALCGALVGVLSWLSNDAQLRQLSLWGMGSLGQAEWPTLLVAATLIIPAALAVWWMASRLNLLQLGDEEAHYLGVNVQALQRWLLLCSAVLVAAAVAISGVIGFIGLVVPHLMRLWLGPDHRGLIPGSLLAGAILLLLADTWLAPWRRRRRYRSVCSPACWAPPGFCGWSFVGRTPDMVNEYCAQGLSLHLGKRQIIDNVSVALRGGRDDGAYRAERRREIHSAAPVDRLSDSGQRHPPSCRQAAGGLVPRGAVAPAGGHAAANGPAGRLDGGNGHCHGTLTVGRDGGSGGAGGGDGRHRLRWPCRSPLSRPLRRRAAAGAAGPLSGAAMARRRAAGLAVSR